MGAMGQEKESRGYSGERIVAILKQLDYIDTSTVHQQMWDYNISQGDETAPSRRNTERMTKVLRCASDAIYHHARLSRRSESTHQEIFNLTDDDREQVRSGSSHANGGRSKDYSILAGREWYAINFRY